MINGSSIFFILGGSIQPPATQTSNIIITNVSETSLQLNFTRGNGNKVLIIVKKDNAVDSLPVDDVFYEAAASFGEGSELGTGNYVIYKGTGTSCVVTNLEQSSTYHFRAFEFNGEDNREKYQTSTATGNPASRSIWTPEWQAVIDEYNLNGWTLPTIEEQSVVDSAIQYSKISGDWDNIYLLYFYGYQQNQCKINLKNPSGTKATFEGTPPTVTGLGMPLNGSNYMRTNVPLNTIVGFGQDNNSAGSIVLTTSEVGVTDKCLFGVNSSAVQFKIYQNSTVGREMRIFNNNNTVVDYVGSSSFQNNSYYGISRYANNNEDGFKNGAKVVDGSALSTGIPSRDEGIGAMNNNGTFAEMLNAELLMKFTGNSSVSHFNMDLIWRQFVQNPTVPLDPEDFESGTVMPNLTLNGVIGFTHDYLDAEYLTVEIINSSNIDVSNIVVRGAMVIQDCSNVVVNGFDFTDCETYSHYLKVKGNCDSIEIVNCNFQRTDTSKFDTEQLGIQIKVYTCTNMHIHDNTFTNMQDGWQATFYPNVVSDISGMNSHDNVYLTEPAWWGHTENAIDIKVGALDIMNPILIHDETISGYYASPTSAGDAIVCHRDCINVFITGCDITNCLYKLGVKPYNPYGPYIDRNVWFDGVWIDMNGVNVTKHIPG